MVLRHQRYNSRVFMSGSTVRFIIKRQASPHSAPYLAEFGMNVIIGLMDIAANPVDRFGKPTTPVTYESNCLEEVCGSCAMLINGKAAMPCSSLVNKLEQPRPSGALVPLSGGS